MLPTDQEIGASTRSLHADDALNVVADVAPPLHVATTFRYSDDPNKLTPVADLSGVSRQSACYPITGGH
jgi:cystathionine beta-lyase